MKNRKILFAGLAVLLLGQVSFAQISGTSHDFSGQSWAPTSDKICSLCHTPHQSMSIDNAPLWNHAQTTVASYKLYSSPTFDSQGGTTITDPSASSKLCLSCHDGTVALENFGGITTGSNYIDPAYRIGGPSGNDMSTEHPISFDYTDALAVTDGGLHQPTVANSGLGSTIAADMLFNNKMECASCHDVHNNYGVPGLLKMSNTNSELCLTCHDK